MIGSVKNAVAFVTGGSSGLGLGTIRQLLNQGIKGCVAFDMNTPEFKHDNLFAIKGDVTKESDVQEALESSENRFGKIDAVVNCAGIAVAAKIYDSKREKIHSLEDFKRVLEVNTVGTFNVCRLAAPILAKNEMQANGQRGCMILTSSTASIEAQVGQIAYAASKGAVNGMTLAIARDLSPIGIRCVTIAPGPFDTPLMSKLPPKVKQQLGATVPCPARLGDPLEFGHLVQSIIENGYINGEIIRLDGALRMQP
ncbi:3-hydroxyacyl-CoA dehydrogenase type-2, partial [Fragariocoptes setiger]